MNIEAARQAGYSDAEIADELARRTGRDAAGARQAGYSDADIIAEFGRGNNQMKWGEVPGAALSNLPSSAGRFAGDMAAAVSHPLDTAKSLGGVLDSAENKLVNFVSGRKDGEPLTGWQKFWGLDGSEDKANAVGQYFADRYGSIEGFKNSLATDPVGVLADMSTVFTGGAGAAKGIAKGAQLAGKAGLAEGLGRAAELAGTAASMTDPISLAGKGVGAIGRGVSAITPDALKVTPEKLYGSALKPSTTLSPDKRAAIIQTGIQERILPNAVGNDKLGGIRQQLGEQIGNIVGERANLEASGAVPRTIDPEALVSGAMDYTGNKLGYSPNKGILLGRADNTFTNFLDNFGPSNLDTETAQRIKQRAQLESKKAYDEPLTTPAQEANKALARQLRVAIEQNVPEVAPLNQRLSRLEALSDPVERAAARSGNWDWLGLGAGLSGGGGLGWALGGPTGAAIGAAAGMVGRQPGTKARAAFALDSARSAMNSPTAQLMEQVFSEIRPPATAGAYAGERAKESYADMLRRHGVNITLGQ